MPPTSQRHHIKQDGTQQILRNGPRYGSGRIVMGRVWRVNTGTYSVLVGDSSDYNVACTMLTPGSSYYLGVNDCALPVEGSTVVVWLPNGKRSAFGIVLGVAPSCSTVPVLNTDKKPPISIKHVWDMEPGVGNSTDQPSLLPLETKEDVNIRNAHNGRPDDIQPGNRMMVNEQGVGIAILNLLLSLKASQRARIDVSLVDDLVRVISGHFQHLSAQGEQHIYNDGGYLSEYLAKALYQCEKSGYKDYGTELFQDDDNAADFSKEAKEARYSLKEPDIEPRYRLQQFVGFLGDLINLFVYNPDPDKNPGKVTEDSLHQGLAHAHVDSSGRVTVRSAAGISLQRTDKIAVPQKRREPWDPEGTQAEKPNFVPDAKEPYQYPDDHPFARCLTGRDATAWYNGLAYTRIRSMPDDWYVPEEQDLKTPKDEYDEVSKSTEQFSKHENKQANISIEDDGSIILRDAWGSEIIMSGGNITLSAAANVLVRPGKSCVVLAGDDAIIKARNSVDITASDKDVRVKANVNLQLCSTGGGVLVEASGSGGPMYGGKGEAVRSRGVIIKAEQSGVLLTGKRTYLNGTDGITLDTFDADGIPHGDVVLSANNFYSSTADSTFLTNGANTALFLGETGAYLAGMSTGMVAGMSAFISIGATMWVPLSKPPIKTNPYGGFQPSIEEVMTWLQDSSFPSPFGPDERKDFQFSYRSSDEYDTLRALEVDPAATEFRIYRAAWASMATAGAQQVPGIPTPWKDAALDDRYAWPGEAPYSAPSYFKMTMENNVDAATGAAKPSDELKNTPASIVGDKFGSYEVLV